MITINGAEEDLQSLVAQQAFCTPPAIPLPPIPPPECDMTKDWEGDPKANTNIVYINPADGQRYIAGSSPVKFDTDSGGEYFSDDGDTKTTTNKLCQLALRSKDGRSVYYILDNLYDFDDENMWEWVNDPSGPVDLVYGNAGFWRQQLTGGEGFISFIKCTLCPDKCGDSVKDPWEACDLGPGGKRVLGSCRFCDDGTLTGICEQGCTKYRTRCTGGTPDGLSCI
jgi:hypothetical protein